MNDRQYKGALKNRVLSITILSGEEDEFKQARLKLHAALFHEFGLTPPNPDDASNPVWRDLALALAARHVPAFKPEPGKPKNQASRDEDLKWHLASRFFLYQDGGTIVDSDRKAAEYFGVNYDHSVMPRLKQLRKNGTLKQGGHFDELFEKIKERFGLEELLKALRPGQLNNEFMRQTGIEIKRLRDFPY